MYKLENVSRNFNGEYALKNISLTITGGMNYIIGASGSGKTTLLKIISSMDTSFDGQASYKDINLKRLNNALKCEYYTNTIGFIWQNFNLVDDLTVIENIKIPLYLKKEVSTKQITKILKELKIEKLASEKIKNLSGGEKQRVAIARELLKDNGVIIADEPTAALDSKSADAIMAILKTISETKTVIIVTHNTSYIDSSCRVFELDKGELVSTSGKSLKSKKTEPRKSKQKKLSLKNSFAASVINTRSKPARSIILILTMILSVSFLLINTSGQIKNSNDLIFDSLIDTYGEGLLDISIVSSFMSASSSGTDSLTGSVTQKISGLYGTYGEDDRVETILYSQAFSNINVEFGEGNYPIESTGNVPVFENLIAGSYVSQDNNEVIVPESFVQSLGYSNDDIIGMEIGFNGTIYNWDTGQPIKMPVYLEVVITGVANNDMVMDINGIPKLIQISDSFFFSQSALTQLRAQANKSMDDISFTMRAHSPVDMISLKDDLNRSGIVPLGRFELLEDIVRLDEQSSKQADSALISIGILGFALLISISLITAITRKNEYAIYKINGYNKHNLMLISLMEHIITGVSALGIYFLISPLTNIIIDSLFDSSIINKESYVLILCLFAIVTTISFIVTSTIAINVKEFKSLKMGER